MDTIIENVLYMPFISGIIFMITAAVMYLFPPKKINYLYGYRTTGSMKSQHRWDFAQRYSSIKMFQVGVALFVLAFFSCFFKISDAVNLGIGIAMMIPACIVMFLSTERALKKNFPND